MTAKIVFCPDCDHERTVGSDVISIAPDHGWAAEFTAPLAQGQEPSGGLGVMTTPDGTRWDTWRVPVVGWAIVECHPPYSEGHERSIEPVLLAEGEFPGTMTDYRADHNMTGVRTMLRWLGGPPPPGSGHQLQAVPS